MKYEKFEGSLGEFLEQHGTDSVKFSRIIPHGFTGLNSYSLKQLVLFYNEGEIYIEKEEVWTDHLPVLCWVSYCLMKETPVVIESRDEHGWYIAEDGEKYGEARPVTQEEINNLIWTGASK